MQKAHANVHENMCICKVQKARAEYAQKNTRMCKYARKADNLNNTSNIFLAFDIICQCIFTNCVLSGSYIYYLYTASNY